MGTLIQTLSRLSSIMKFLNVVLSIMWSMAGAFMISQGFILKGIACFGLSLVFVISYQFISNDQKIKDLKESLLKDLIIICNNLNLSDSNTNRAKIKLILFHFHETLSQQGIEIDKNLWKKENNRPESELLSKVMDTYFSLSSEIRNLLNNVMNMEEKQAVEKYSSLFEKDLVELNSIVDRSHALRSTNNNENIVFKKAK